MKTPSGDRIECPSCGSANLRFSSKPHFMNLFMALVMRDPIRCNNCHHRFYAQAMTDMEYSQATREMAQAGADRRRR